MTYPQAVAANIKAGVYDFHRGVDILNLNMPYANAKEAVEMALVRINGCDLRESK